MTAQPTDEDLSTIAEQVWSSYLDPEGVSPLLPFPSPRQLVEVSASVSVTGAWRGHVVLSCSSNASKNAAAVGDTVRDLGSYYVPFLMFPGLKVATRD